MHNKENEGKYDYMLDMHHPTSKTHPRMPIKKRAAQFAAFKALDGFDEQIDREVERHNELADGELIHIKFEDFE